MRTHYRTSIAADIAAHKAGSFKMQNVYIGQSCSPSQLIPIVQVNEPKLAVQNSSLLLSQKRRNYLNKKEEEDSKTKLKY